MSRSNISPPLVREARRGAGMTQAALAERLGIAQSQVARLEAEGANPTLHTLGRVMAATGHRLVLAREPRRRLPDVDEGQLRRHLAMSPAERLRIHDISRRNVMEMVAGARRMERDDR